MYALSRKSICQFVDFVIKHINHKYCLHSTTCVTYLKIVSSFFIQMTSKYIAILSSSYLDAEGLQNVLCEANINNW